jgi:DNA polymerase III subunit delta
MAQSTDQILKSLQEGKYAPLYLLQGEEPFFIDLVVNYIEKNAIPEHERGFNQIILYGKDAKLGQVIGSARSFPMMGMRQLILIKEAQDMEDLKRDEAAVEILIKYAENPQPSTILVFAHKYKKLDARSKLFKAFDKSAVVLDAAKLQDYKVVSWIESHAKTIGLTISDKAAYLMSELLGNNLERIHNELSKISVLAKGASIDESLVKEHVGVSKEYNSFELSKAIAVRNYPKTVKIFEFMAGDQKNHPFVLTIGYLYSYMSKLLQLHSLGSNISEGQVMSVLKIPPFAAKEYVIACRNYPAVKVIQIIHHLRHAEAQYKGVVANNLDEYQIFRELAYKIVH